MRIQLYAFLVHLIGKSPRTQFEMVINPRIKRENIVKLHQINKQVCNNKDRDNQNEREMSEMLLSEQSG